MDKTKVTKDLPNKTLVIERSFNASKEKLWAFYAEKEKFEAWWGPEGWQTTTKQFEFKSGGRIHYCMKCVDQNQTEWYGKESWGLMDIETMSAPDRFSALDAFTDESGQINSSMPTQRFEVELVEENGVTRLICKVVAESAEKLEEVIKMGMIEGFDSQLNKLEAQIKE